MLIDLRHFKGLMSSPLGEVVHVGAHQAEERDRYLSAGFSNRVWIEANPVLIEDLKTNFGAVDEVLSSAVWSSPGQKLTLKITNNSQASSLLSMKRHLEEHPEVRLEREIQVVTETLDNLLGVRKVSFLNLDIQGAELHALEGFCEGLPFTEVISSEVNFIEIYENCPMVGDLDDFLATYGFQRILTRRLIHGWGDALYAKTSLPWKFRWRFAFLQIAFSVSRLVLQLPYNILKRARRM
jgi:FkbM family methyltransferase